MLVVEGSSGFNGRDEPK